MIIHCTQKLAAKLDNVSRDLLQDSNPLGGWHANLYVINRRQCVMFCHDKTRFVLFIPGLKKNDFDNLDFWFKDLFANTMLKLGYDPELIEKKTRVREQLFLILVPKLGTHLIYFQLYV